MKIIHRKRRGVVVTPFMMMLSIVLLLLLLPSVEAYFFHTIGRSGSTRDASEWGSCSSFRRGITRKICTSNDEGKMSSCLHVCKLPLGRNKVALSMSRPQTTATQTAPLSSSSSSSPSSSSFSSSINKERWRRRKYLMTVFLINALSYPLYAGFKVLELGLTTSLRVVNFLLSLPLVSLIGKPLQGAVKDLFTVKLPMLEYLWPKDKGSFSHEFRSKVFLLASFIMMFLGKISMCMFVSVFVCAYVMCVCASCYYLFVPVLTYQM